MALTTREMSEVHYLYHSVIHLAIILDMRPNDEQRECLISMLLKEAARDPEDDTTLFLRAAINYLRSTK